ncbi:MAG: putative ABC transporter permease [Bacillota bacterium]|jgi:uncharacterized membrane protein
MEKKLFNFGVGKLQTIQKYFIYFLLYSAIGWLYEVLLEYFVYQNGFINRGVLFGPYCPVYGLGTLVFLLCFNKALKAECKFWLRYLRLFLLFFGCMAVATLLELLTSYILEFFTGGWPWDYFKYDINFQGRVALSPSIRFGLGGIFFLYLVQPRFEKLTGKMSPKVLNVVFGILFGIFSCDLLVWVCKTLF